MINIVRSSKPEKSFEYNDFEIDEIIRSDFFELCYICEEHIPRQYEIDHWLPKGQTEFADKIHDWDNLFYICPKCNKIRPKNINTEGEEVLNNCKDDVEKLIYLQFIDNKVKVIINNNDSKTINTKKLLNRIYNGIDSNSKSYIYLREEIEKVIKKFEEIVKRYFTNKELYEKELKNSLSKKTKSGDSAFISFKRQIVRLKYKEFEKYFD